MTGPAPTPAYAPAPTVTLSSILLGNDSRNIFAAQTSTMAVSLDTPVSQASGFGFRKILLQVSHEKSSKTKKDVRIKVNLPLQFYSCCFGDYMRSRQLCHEGWKEDNQEI